MQDYEYKKIIKRIRNFYNNGINDWERAKICGLGVSPYPFESYLFAVDLIKASIPFNKIIIPVSILYSILDVINNIILQNNELFKDKNNFAQFYLKIKPYIRIIVYPYEDLEISEKIIFGGFIF